MLVKTASIEVARIHPQAVLVALHPGTVNSALSAPFNGAEIGRPAADAAGDMLRVLDGLTRIFHRSRATNEYGIALVCPKIQVSNLDQRAGNAEAKLYRRN